MYESHRLAQRAALMERSAMQDMLVETAERDVLSFALGLPAPELFPVDAYQRAVATAMQRGPELLQYGPPSDILKAHVVDLMAQRGVDCRPEQVLFTNGAQQGLSMLAQLLLDDGGEVVLEELSYPGMQQVIRLFSPDVVTVPVDPAAGIDVEALDDLLARRSPAFLYTISSGHNPLGLSLVPETRAELVATARRHRTPIIEDDAYGFIYYDGAPEPALRAHDDNWVFYVGSFSKILAPALRTGWIIVPASLLPKMEIIKEASDINTGTFAQRTITAFLENGSLLDHLIWLRREYRTRRDAMLTALRQHFPTSAHWQAPSSGFFVWVVLPEYIDTEAMLWTAIEEARVAYVPGRAFCSNGGHAGANCMRLNFSHCTPQHIDAGIARLGALIERELERVPAHP